MYRITLFMKKLTALALSLWVFISAFAQTNDSILHPSLKLDLVLFDLPYQFDAAKTVNDGTLNFGSFMNGYANPSMAQSLSLTSSMYGGAHYGIDKLFHVSDRYSETKSKFWHLSALFLSDYILTYAPGGEGWLHEEFHRAVMTRHHVNSFDEMNTFPIGAESVSVSHITDEDLVRFKNENPYDFIRMHVAGIEGEYLLIDELQRNNFFYNQHLTHEILYWLITLNSISYVSVCSDPDYVDEETDIMNNKEENIADRDFTGFDFSAWAYDLFNPDEPYEQRGTHPSGTGIDRYIKTSDLSDEALSYLEKQGKLQWLNILSPMLYFQKSINFDNTYYFNFAVRNILTSFGNDISLNVFLKNDSKNFIFSYHHASNYERFFPAIDVELFEYPVEWKKQTFLVSPRIISGFQPKGQEFFTSQSEFLGFAGCRVDWIPNKVHPWFEVTAKTNGWIAGNEFLESNVNLKFGLSARFSK